MLKKESFFQYLFIQSLGFSNTQMSNILGEAAEHQSTLERSTINTERKTTLVKDEVSQQLLNSKSNDRGILLTPLKLKTVKSQTFLLLFTKNKKTKNKPNYRLKFKSLDNNLLPSNKENNLKKLSSLKTGQVNVSTSLPQELKINKSFKISQKVFLFNKELKKLYIPTGANLQSVVSSNYLNHKKANQHRPLLHEKIEHNLKGLTNYQLEQTAMPSRSRMTKKDKNKENLKKSYNIFLTYKKSFLSYWLLPFFGLISLTGSNLPSISEKHKLNTSNQYSKTTSIFETNNFEIPSISKKNLESNYLNKAETNNSDYVNLNWQTMFGASTQLSQNGQKNLLNTNSSNSLFLKNQTTWFGLNSGHYSDKHLFFKMFDLTYNPKNTWDIGSNGNLITKQIGNFAKTQTNKNTKASQINFQTINFEILKTKLQKSKNFKSTFFYNPSLKLENSSQEGEIATAKSESSQLTNFPNKLLCNFGQLNEFNILEKQPSTFMFNKRESKDLNELQLTKLKEYTIFKSNLNLQKFEIPTSRSASLDYLNTWNFKKFLSTNQLDKNTYEQKTFKRGLFEQTKKLELNGSLIGISRFTPNQKYVGLNIKLVQALNKQVPFSSKPSNKTLTWSTIKAKYTKLLSTKKTIQKDFYTSKLEQNNKLNTIFAKDSKKLLVFAPLNPEKSLKKALFLLDSVWLNSLYSLGLDGGLVGEKTWEAFLKSLSEGRQQNKTVIDLLKMTSSISDDSSDWFINYSDSLGQKSNVNNNKQILKTIGKLNDNIVFLLKSKSKETPDRASISKTTTSNSTNSIEKGKVLSINNRNLLYTCIFEGLKNNLNQIIKTTIYNVNSQQSSGHLSLTEKNTLDLSLGQHLTNKASFEGTILKLNRPVFGGNVSKFDSKRDSLDSTAYYLETKQSSNNLGSLNNTGEFAISNKIDSLKNPDKLNIKISNLQINLISPKLNFENATKSTNLTWSEGFSEGQILQKTKDKQQITNAPTNRLGQKEPFVIFGKYLNTITTKIKKGFVGQLGLSPKQPYQTNLGNSYLWNFDNSLNAKKAVEKKEITNNYISIKKLVNKNSLPKFERLFLSYLSQSKLGEKNKLNLGRKSKSTDRKVLPKLQISQKSIHASQVATLPLKIKNLSKNKLVMLSQQGQHIKSLSKKYSLKTNQIKSTDLKKLTSIKTNFRKSFTILLKNRLFVNKKQNGEYWGTLTTNSLKTSNIMDRTDKIIQESRRKKQQIKLKRRLKKMQCATRRRKKRKIFYPRPKWLTFTMYENFLKSRFSSPSKTNLTKTNLTPKYCLNLTKIQPVINGTFWDKKSKDFYQISPIVSRDLRRILMKSNWLRNYLNPYLEKIKYIYKEIEKDSKNLDIFFKLKAFINNLYGSNLTWNKVPIDSFAEQQNPQFDNSKTYWQNSTVGLDTSHKPIPNKALLNMDKKASIGLDDAILNFEYNRIMYQRLQRIILNIRENLNLNGQLKTRSQKLGKNIRPFIKRDYIKRDNPMAGNQNENSFTKTMKKNLLNFRRNFIMLNNGYEEPSIYTTESLSPLVRNNFYWALNRTEKTLTMNPNSSYIKNVWEKYKIREINKNNKTKKMLFSLVNKYQNLLSDQNILESFNNNLETDLSIPEGLDTVQEPIKLKKFYKQKTVAMSEKHRQAYYNFIYEKPAIRSLSSSLTEESKNTAYFSDSLLSENKRLQNLEKLNNNFINTQAKIKRNLLATKNYIDKTEKKLINVENKLKLLGLASTKGLKPSSLYSSSVLNTNGFNSLPGFESVSVKYLSTHNLYNELINNQELTKHSNPSFIQNTTNLSNQNNATKEQRNFVRISRLKYKKAYFRFLKQQLLKENKFFVPYAKRNITGIGSGSFLYAEQPYYLEKMEKLFYTLKQRSLAETIASQNNLSEIKLTNNSQNYNKFSSTTYWWTKVQINKYLSPKYTVGTQTKNPYSNSFSNTNPTSFQFNVGTSVIPSQNISIHLVSILFHFCTVLTLVSLGGVRNVLKFYYILISKLYKVINTLRFAKIFPTKVQKTTFNVPVLSERQTGTTKQNSWSNSIDDQLNRDNLGSQLSKSIVTPENNSMNLETTLEGTRGNNKKMFISSSLPKGHKLLVTSFKTIKLLSLKYLLVNVQTKVTNSNQFNLLKTFDGTETKLNKIIESFTQDIQVQDLISNELQKPVSSLSIENNTFKGKKSNGLSLSSSTLKTGMASKQSNILELVNIYLQSKNISQKSKPLTNTTVSSLPVEQKKLNIQGSKLNSIKIEVLFDTNKNLSIGLNFIHKVSFYTYLLMLKSVDVLVAPAYLIYKFFEKPGEYVVENLAYSFLLEWSADLISTIPDSIDPALATYYMKLQRNLPLYLFLNPKNINIGLIGQNTLFSKVGLNTVNTNTMVFNNNNLVNSGLKTFVNTMESIFGIFVLSIQNSILRRFTNSSILLFTQQITEPDSDFINRQKKGIIFWDLWGESLKTIAEKNAVNIYELSTDKAEQLKLLSNMQNSNLLNPTQNSFTLNQTKIYTRSLLTVSNGNNNQTQTQQVVNKTIIFKTQTHTQNWLSRLGNIELKLRFNSTNQIFGLNLLDLEETTDLNKFGNNKYLTRNSGQKASLFESQRWAVNQFLNYQGKDTELFIDMHPPRTFSNTATALKYAFSIQAPIGSIVCQIFGGIFYKQISKNILVVLHNSSQTNKSLEKSLLIQAIAGETELKIITDNAHRYAMVVQGVAVGIKLLKDVFEALCATGPCIFLLEDIHTIGERRPFLIDEASPNLTESIYNKNQSMQAFLLKEKSSASREILYKTNKHLLTNYKKPYKEFKSLASNHFSFNFLYHRSSLTKTRTGDINSTEVPLSIQVSQKDKETQDTNLDKKSSFDVPTTAKKVSNPNNILNKRYILESNSQKSNYSNKVFGSFSQLIQSIKNKQSLINPPASSPFNLLLMKESTKLKPTQTVKEMAWFGLPGEQYSLISKYNYSIRVKVALLADSVLSNLSVKLEMITDLLVIIDSVKGNRGFIIFATTHLPDILDPALRRPGRFDETLSLPFIPSLYSRWTNYRYNLQYLTSSLSHKGMDLTRGFSTGISFNKGTTLDFSKLSMTYSNSQMEALFPIYNSMKSFGRMTRLKNQNTDISLSHNSFGVIGREPANLVLTKIKNDKTPNLSYLVKDFLRFSYNRSASYASNTILSLTLCLYTSGADFKTSINNPNKNINLTSQMKKLTVLKWPTMLRLSSAALNSKKSNYNSNLFDNYSNYLSLFAPTYFNNTSFGQMILLSFITYKIGESLCPISRDFVFSTNMLNSGQVLSTEQTGQVKNLGTKIASKNSKKTLKNGELKRSFNSINPFVLNFSKNSEWKKGPSLLYNYLQKRLPQNPVHQTGKQNFNYSTFYSTQLLNFNNNYSLMEPPSPPITNILLPAKRYENYRRSFKNLYNLNLELDTVSEKLKLHQQQRLLKRLYNYPIKEFFRNEKFSWWNSSMPEEGKVKNKLNKSKSLGLKDKITFAQSYFTFAGIENFAQKNMASLNKFSSIDYSYRNILYNRHKTFLTNQWWNGQQGEHNLETTFLSDIDWRYTQLSNSLSNDDIQVDFPDCEQFYNPRNRRWILTTGDWNYWFNLDADLNNIYSHYISESLTKAYKTIDQNREILDFYSVKQLSNSFNLLDLVDSVYPKGVNFESVASPAASRGNYGHKYNAVSSISKTKVNILVEDLTHREILNLYKRFFYKSAGKAS